MRHTGSFVAILATALLLAQAVAQATDEPDDIAGDQPALRMIVLRRVVDMPAVVP